MKFIFLTCLMTLLARPAFSAPTAADKAKFKSGKQESFDTQVVEGQIYRPDLSVVTGDTSLGGFGTLRLRNDFVDHAKAEAFEGEAP